MKNNILYTALFLIMLSVIGCTKTEELQDDPNRATQVTPSLILTNIEVQAFGNISLNAGMASRYLSFTNSVNVNQYYNWSQSPTSYDDYDNLKQVSKMVEEAERTEEEVYAILAKFFNSYFIVELTQVFGDVPYSESVKVTEEIYAPKYDAQKDIFVKVLNDLKEASDALAQTDGSIAGDIIYQGDKGKWRKLINSYYLRILIGLSRKADVAELNIAARFNEVVADPAKYPLFESNDDNGALEYFNIQDSRYPYFNDNDIQTAYYMETTFVDRLKAFEDPRLFVFADNKSSSTNAEETDFNAYDGLLGSAPFDEISAKAVAGEASRLDSRYYFDPINEPSLLMGYAELQFVLAEAASRNWIAGDVDDYYKEGIRASFDFFNVNGVDDYLAKPAVQLDATNTIKSILEQKHIAMFMNAGWQIFFEQRRTGFPEFDVSGGGVLNGGRIPKRWLYPESETTNNTANLEEAISRQFPNGDNINGVMWLVE